MTNDLYSSQRVANPKPKTEQLTPFQRKDPSAEPLAERQTQVKLPLSLDAVVRAMGAKKADWLRAAVAEKAEREGLI